MTTGGGVQGQCPVSVGSEDLGQLKCQPCLDDGNLHEAVGMCIDCQDCLCSHCFKIHTQPKPLRNHQLLDKEQMLYSQIRTRPKDICTAKCSAHEDKIIEYYCTTHSKLGCTVCITLDHTTCKGVQYIPHVTKDLTNNEEYRQVESQLKSALEVFEKVAENVQKNTKELGTTCNEALEKMKEYRRKIEEAFDKIEAKLVKQAQAFKSKEINELEAIGDKYKKACEEVQAALAKITALQKSKRNCSLYIEMMRTKDKLKSMDGQIKEAEVDMSYRKCQINFTPNQKTLDSVQNSETFGILSESDKRTQFNQSKGVIVSAKHTCDIKVKTATDAATCTISGLVTLPDGRLVLADTSGNSKIKTVNVQSCQVLTELKLSSVPWDVTAINNNKVAVTLPNEKKIAIVTFGQDGTTLYVSNQIGDNIMCVKLNGTVVATYTDSGLKSPLKPVVDSHGNVYVCTQGSSKVHQISKVCKKMQVLLTRADGLDRPYSICLSQEEEKLYVGLENNDNIKVYTTKCRPQ